MNLSRYTYIIFLFTQLVNEPIYMHNIMETCATGSSYNIIYTWKAINYSELKHRKKTTSHKYSTSRAIKFHIA